MKYFRNVYTEAVVSEFELQSMHLREYNRMWEEDKLQAPKELLQKRTEFVRYMVENDLDPDFEEIKTYNIEELENLTFWELDIYDDSIPEEIEEEEWEEETV